MASPAILNQVRTNLTQIASGTEELRVLSGTLGTERDSIKLRENMRRKMQEANRILKSIHSTLCTLPPEIKEVSELYARCEAYSKQLTDVISMVQRKARDTLPALKNRASQAELDLQQRQFDSEVQMHQKLVREHAEQVHQLAQDVGMLQDMCVKIGAMTVQQSEQVTDIRDHTTEARALVEKGRTHLEKAKQKQNKTFKIQWLLILLVMVLCAIGGFFLTRWLLSLIPSGKNGNEAGFPAFINAIE